MTGRQPHRRRPGESDTAVGPGVGLVAAALVATLAVVGCGAGDASEAEVTERVECDPAPPSALPSGAPPGAPVEREGDRGQVAMVWGDEDDMVAQLWGAELEAYYHREYGEDALDGEFRGWPEESEQVIEVGDEVRLVVPVGDTPAGEVQILFERDGCRYISWVGPGLELDDAIEYAELRF